jgi:hypothetical protein
MKAAAGFQVAVFMQAVNKQILLIIAKRLVLALGAAMIVAHVEVMSNGILQSMSREKLDLKACALSILTPVIVPRAACHVEYMYYEWKMAVSPGVVIEIALR